eukprot:TRINITY_DN2823_c0_g1_i1.p1 TRINITY_DN2823_c0_g1~~TRINITY_DN2823_c0_g1_i1.p1  ORF type:complete len:198 (+),score=36.31 TRINITY_DN2823_c0_g1_i1:232-825(+)
MTTTLGEFPSEPYQCIETECARKCCIGDSCGNILQCNEWLLALIVILGGALIFCLIIFVIWGLQSSPNEVVAASNRETVREESRRAARNGSLSSNSEAEEVQVKNNAKRSSGGIFSGYNIEERVEDRRRSANFSTSNMGDEGYDQWGGLEEIKEDRTNKNVQPEHYASVKTGHLNKSANHVLNRNPAYTNGMYVYSQ